MTHPDPATGIARNITAYGDAEFSRYMRRAFLASAGFDAITLDRPIVGIVDTSSDYNTCHRQMPEMVAAIKRGVIEAGGCPFAFPTISLHEILTSPTTMLFRNLAAMDTEEMIAAQPMDAVVMLGGCDKTVPAQLMAAASANIPALSVVSGPMLTGYWRGERLGACTDCRRYWAQYRAGRLGADEIREIEQALCFTGGTCMVMGTASTMACVTEALGLMLPGGATPPMSSGERLRHCVEAGRRAVEIARAGRRPRDILTRAAFHNALTALMAIGGSTNAIVHLLAIARRAGIPLAIDDFDAISRRVPLLVDCKPAGSGYLEDMHFAGGMPVLLKALEPLLDLSARMITGQTMGEYLRNIPPPGAWQTTIRTLAEPLGPTGALAIVKGSLAPDGAVIKAAAASKNLMKHRGPAVVFDSPEDAEQRIDDP
ncbi:MAG TPA: dihydroxy-acid dehydratase [Candidatus Hydrogenedentes bacterium]|nr:dihydroxy-acid dehydratase [Candidatus Hydrogenedentota bacterium]